MHVQAAVIGVAAVLTLTGVLPASAQAQRGRATVHAQVSDTAGNPLAGAVVWVGLRLSVLTDQLGRATLRDIPAGVHLVRAGHDRYRTESVLLEIAAGATVEVDFEMVGSTVDYELAPITVEVQRRVPQLVRTGYYDRKRIGVGSFVERDEIARWDGYPDVDVIVRSLRGFDTRPNPNGFGFHVVSTRGTTTLEPERFYCRPDIIVDGFPADLDMLYSLSPSHIEAIEGYSGPASTPQEFRMGLNSMTCGIIVIWTRR
jgi:hypothetical protein